MASTPLSSPLCTVQCSGRNKFLSQDVITARLHPAPSPRVRFTVKSKPWTILRRSSDGNSPEQKPDSDSESLIERSLDLQAETDRILDSDASKELLKDLADASARVTSARQALDDVLRREREVMEAQYQLENRAFWGKDLESAEALEEARARDVAAAEAELREAGLALIQARAGPSFPGAESEGIDVDLERIESGKAAAISGAVGTLASVPVALSLVGDRGGDGNPVEIVVTLAGVLVSCMLFGLSYRYIVRRDLQNTNLKAGAVAAFGLVRGIAIVDTTLSSSGASLKIVPQLLQAALDAGESVLVFAFAAIALDACFQRDILQPFPIKK